MADIWQAFGYLYSYKWAYFQESYTKYLNTATQFRALYWAKNQAFVKHVLSDGWSYALPAVFKPPYWSYNTSYYQVSAILISCKFKSEEKTFQTGTFNLWFVEQNHHHLENPVPMLLNCRILGKSHRTRFDFNQSLLRSVL